MVLLQNKDAHVREADHEVSPVVDARSSYFHVTSAVALRDSKV